MHTKESATHCKIRREAGLHHSRLEMIWNDPSERRFSARSHFFIMRVKYCIRDIFCPMTSFFRYAIKNIETVFFRNIFSEHGCEILGNAFFPSIFFDPLHGKKNAFS